MFTDLARLIVLLLDMATHDRAIDKLRSGRRAMNLESGPDGLPDWKVKSEIDAARALLSANIKIIPTSHSTNSPK